MNDIVSAALALIQRVERKPWLLEKRRTGSMLSVEIGEAALLVADNAARRKDLETLRWLWDLFISTFNEYQPPDGSGASSIDIYEYVTDLEYIVRDHENPFNNAVLMKYRQSIVDDLKQVREELGHRPKPT